MFDVECIVVTPTQSGNDGMLSPTKNVLRPTNQQPLGAMKYNQVQPKITMSLT